MGSKILIVEDEKDLVKLIRYNLEKEGFSVVSTMDGALAGSDFSREKPDLVILDVMLPGKNGFEICRDLRKDSSVPILMLTAKREEVDKVLGLEIGADDYVTKPFSMRELMARVKSLLRRASPSLSKGVFNFGKLQIDLERYVVSVAGKKVQLTSREFDFLKALVEAKGKALTRDSLLERVWGVDQASEIDTRTIDQHMARLRSKLGPEAERLITVKNVGYRLRTEAKE